MRSVIGTALSACALLAVAACMPAAGDGMVSAKVRAEQACLQAVKAETGNPVARIGSSDPTRAGTEVIVAVGRQQAAWQCIAYPDGSTSRPMSMTNEGTL
ncbi:hypothetical protein [Salipiger sp.]|uniref:hypothetical protein n=1 Tax=Salipiger sp. TaxID=2078585 RepID=UPI003A973378